MLQIKTIKERLDQAASFDEKVNKALQEGWTLTRRAVLHPGAEYTYFSLYAELEQEAIAPHERGCHNCLYCDQDGGEPCDSCDFETLDAWEPKEGAVAMVYLEER